MSKKLQVLQKEEIINPFNIKTIVNSNGTALQFPDGTMICYGKRSWTGLNNNTPVGGLYYTGILGLGDYPIAFVEVPTTYVNACSGAYNVMEYNNRNSLTNIGDMFFANGTSRNNQSASICYIAIGRWKSGGGAIEAFFKKLYFLGRGGVRVN